MLDGQGDSEKNSPMPKPSGIVALLTDYGLQDFAYEVNKEAAVVARQAVDEFMATAADGKTRYVAGALGPTNRTLSLSPDVNDPGFRVVTFDEVKEAYAGWPIRLMVVDEKGKIAFDGGKGPKGFEADKLGDWLAENL